MKIKVNGNRLAEGLKKVGGVANAKITPQILGNVLVDAKDGEMTLMASNLKITLITKVECEVIEAGATTVQAKMLTTMVGAIGAGEIEIATDKNEKMTIRSGELVFKMSGIPAKEFPKPVEPGGAQKYEVEAKELSRMLRKTVFCQCLDMTRKSLQGILFDFSGEYFKCVATDGKGLALAMTKLDWKGHDEKFTVPSEAIAQIQRLVGTEGKVGILANKEALVLDMEDGTRIYGQLLDSQFPNYEVVIPKETKWCAEIDRELFAAALTRVAIMAPDLNPTIVLKFVNGALDLDVAGDNEGSAHDKLAVKYEGESYKLFLNPYRILDPLKAMDADTVKMEFNDEKSQILIKGVDELGLNVLMPMRMQ